MRATCALLFLVGCGDDGGGSIDAAPADAAPLCTHIQQLRRISGVSQVVGAAPHYGGDICIVGRTDIACVQTDMNDRFEMCAPDQAEFAMSFVTAPSVEKTIFLHGPGPQPVEGGRFYVVDNTFAATKYWTPINAAYPPTTFGLLKIFVVKVNGDGTLAPLADAQVAILPSGGVLQVVYGDMNEAPDMTLTQTSSSGSAFIGNMPPDTYDIQVNSTAFPNCSFLHGGYASPDNSQDARIMVRAGFTTYVVMKCTP